jgi:PAS domain S-box-containing protein
MKSPHETTPSASEEILRAALDNAMDGIGIIAMDGTLLYTSLSVESILGYTREEAMKMNMFTLLHPMEYLRAMGLLKRAFDNPGMVLREEFRSKHKDGTWRQLEFVGKSELIHFMNKRALFLNYRDVTDHKKAQQAAERLSLVVETSNDAIFTLSREGAILSWNPSAREIYGYSPEEIGGRHFSLLMPPPEAESFLESLGEVLSGGIRGAFQAVHQTKAGKPLPVSLTLSPIREPGGDINRVSVIARDISGIQTSIETAKRLSSLLENVPSAIFSTDWEGRVILWNRGAETIFGYQAGEMMGQPVDILEPPGKSGEMAKVREEILKNKPLLHYRAQRRKKDGSIIDLEYQLFPAVDAWGKIMGVTAIGQDITDKLHVERALRENEELFRAALENSLDGISIISLDGRPLYVSPSISTIVGYSREEGLEHNIFSVIHPEDLPRAKEKLKWAAEHPGEGMKEEFRYMHKDGSWLVLEVIGKCDYLQSFGTNALILNYRDVTERNKAQQVAEDLAGIVESSNDAIYTLSREGAILSWNQSAAEIYGYSPGEIIGHPYYPLMDPGEMPAFREAQSVVFSAGSLKAFEAVHLTKMGQPLPVSLTLSAIQGPGGEIRLVSVIARDISDQYKSFETAKRLASFLENAPDAIITTDTDNIITFWNRCAEVIFGYKAEEIIGQDGKILQTEVASEEQTKLRERIFSGKDSLLQYETKRRHKDGKVIDIEFRLFPVKNVVGKITGVTGIGRDITEKKKAADIGLRLSEVLEHTPDAIISGDLNGIIINWNQGAEKMFGYTREEALGQSIKILVPPEMEDKQEGIRNRVQEGETIVGFEMLRRRKNGEVFDSSITFSPIRDSQGHLLGVTSITRDISDRKRAEEVLREQETRLQRAQKMDAIGRLAGGVAHDFNNLLSVIGGNADYILDDKDFPENHREEIEEIRKAVKSGADLTHQLLLLGQKHITEPKSVQLNDICREMNKMLKRLIDASIDFEIDLDPDLSYIFADPAQIQQVILNLVINARDAMPKGGKLTLQTRNEKSPGEGFLHGFEPLVKISVIDTGVGMDAETQKKIFEPFFTTKKEKGTGLGLATVYGIVTQWKGQILLKTVLGEGTSFTILFPAQIQPEKPVFSGQAEPLFCEGSETILVVEDEAPLRNIVVKALEKYGYKVLEAGDGSEAVQLCWNYKEPIHLLLTDIVMPKLNGRQLAEELAQSRLKMKILFMSGYPKKILSSKGMLDPEVKLIKKPFSMEDLIQQVRRILDDKSI